MCYRQRLLGVVVVALGAAFALPSHAATKQFSISVNTTSTTTTLTYTNGTQGGGSNSIINSVWFKAPFPVSNVSLQANLVTSNTTISPACATAANTSCQAGTQISITFINGIPTNGGTGVVTMTGSPPNAASSCASALTWSAQAFTGNALGGTNFVSPNGITATATTNVSCVLQFATQPANAAEATNITSQVNDPAGVPVQVQALVGGAVATWFTGPVTLTPSSGTLTGGGVSPDPPVNASAGVATFGSPPTATALTLKDPGIYTVTAMASGFTSATSNPFKIFAGVLNCGDPFASNFVNPKDVMPDQPGYASGMRNKYNKDGVSVECVPVLYTFTNDILDSPLDQVQLSWDTASQPNAAFMYTMNWRPRLVVTSNPGNVQPSPIGWPVTPRPGVAWLNVDGSTTSLPGTPAFIPGLACLSDRLPAPYGALASDVAANATAITVNGIAANPAVIIPGSNPPTPYAVPAPGQPAVPTAPFPIVIADTVNNAQSTVTERLTAKSIVAGSVTPDPSTVNPPTTAGYYTGTYAITYNVTRGTATEGFSNPAFHAGGTLVVSTPLPIIPNDTTTFPAPYIVQRQAQMCIAEHGFMAFTNDANGNAQVMYSTTVIDIGDGYVKGSF